MRSFQGIRIHLYLPISYPEYTPEYYFKSTLRKTDGGFSPDGAPVRSGQHNPYLLLLDQSRVSIQLVGRCGDSNLSRNGLGHASALPWVCLGAVIQKDVPPSPQSPSNCCNPYLVLFSAPGWHPVSPSSVPWHEMVPPESSFRPIIYHVIPRHRKDLKLFGPLIA